MEDVLKDSTAAVNERDPGLKWKLLFPVRKYFLHFPWGLGKGLIQRRILLPSLPLPPNGFVADLGPHGRLALWYRELIGLRVLMTGAFEAAELDFIASTVSEGETVIDVGANVGLFSIALAIAVGRSGKVTAIEPLPSNVHRLKNNVDLNRLDNVNVIQAAAGSEAGVAKLHLARDPAYSSTALIADEGMDSSDSVEVDTVTLDQLWADMGHPQVSFLKVDVEGGEMNVMAGATKMIAKCRPRILVESHDRSSIAEWSSRSHYRERTPRSFFGGNHLLIPTSDVRK